MISVIIAGGSGTRLWPLSTPDYPKHLLQLTGQQSLLNYTFERAKAVGREVYVVTDHSHAHHVEKQLPKLSRDHIIIEPARRGTASCIIAALAKIQSTEPGDEPIAFMAADHYIRDANGFKHSFLNAASIAKKARRVVLIGIEPDYPATGFGYIQKAELYDDARYTFNVGAFKEKPDYQTAVRYLGSGNYLWNSGYFVGTLETFLSAMQNKAPTLFAEYNSLVAAKDLKEFNATYLEFENISIDYALIEKLNDLLVVPANFDWMDLGSFGDLHRAVDSDQDGNHTYGQNILVDEVRNSYIRNEENRPLAVIGLDNVAIVNTPNGILVTRKDLAQKVGEAGKKLS